MLEQIRGPYGDAVVFNTPHLDQATNFLMRDEQMRRQQADRENAQLDQQFNKEFSNVRSADSEDVINSYNQYKQLKKQLLFNKDAQRDPKLYNKLQQASNEALANTYQTINRSQELKKQGELLLQERKAHPEKFSDDFGEKVTAYNQTPMSQLSQHSYGDLSNPDTYRYKGSLTNFQPLLQKAAGTPRDLGVSRETLEPGGLQRRISTFKGANSPYDYYNQLVGSLVGSNAPRDFVGTFGDITPEQEQLITEQYNRLKADPNFKAAYGVTDQQDFPVSAYQTQTGRIAKVLAMQHAINNPIAEKVEFKPVTDALETRREKNRLLMEGVRQGNRVALAQLRHNYKQADKQQQAQMENGVYDEMKAEALKNPHKYKDANGNEYRNYVMNTTPDVQAILAVKDSKGHDIPIDQVVFTPDGYVKGIVYEKEYDSDGNVTGTKPPGKSGYRVDPKLSTKMLESEFKARWIKGIFGVKEAKAQTSGVPSSAPQAAPPVPTKGTYNFNGKNYTHKELNHMGYNDNEIEQYIKAGLIK